MGVQETASGANSSCSPCDQSLSLSFMNMMEEVDLDLTEPAIPSTIAQEPRVEMAEVDSDATTSTCTSKSGTRKKSASFCAPSTPAENPTQRERTASVGANSSMNVQYVGTIAVEGNKESVKQLAVNIAELKQEPYVFVTESALEDSEIAPEMQDQQTEPPTEGSSKTAPTAEEATYWTVRSDFSLQKSSTPVMLDPDGRVTNSQNSSFSSPVPRAASPKVKKKPSQFYPDPESSMQQVRKSRKSRDQTSSLSVSCPLDTSSESTATEDQDCMERPRRGKRPASPMAKMVQEYLHAPSSSDVELPGLDDKVQVPLRDHGTNDINSRDSLHCTPVEPPLPQPLDDDAAEEEGEDDIGAGTDAPLELQWLGANMFQQKKLLPEK